MKRIWTIPNPLLLVIKAPTRPPRGEENKVKSEKWSVLTSLNENPRSDASQWHFSPFTLHQSSANSITLLTASFNPSRFLPPAVAK